MPLIGTRKNPKGPDLRNLETHLFNLSGTRVKFRAPAHYHDAIGATPPHKENVNLYEQDLFDRLDEEDLAEPPSYPLELKYWRFKGVPILDGTGVLGDMRLHVSIQHLPEFISLFRPLHLECAVERCIYSSPNAYKNSGQCRLDWQVREINGSDWVGYRSHHLTTDEGCGYESVWHTPITDEHLLTVRFNQGIGKKRTRLAEVYEKIIDLVMGSVKIQLSSDAKAQQAYIKQLYPDERLSEYLPPYQFEEIELLEELDLINLISAENNHDLSIPDDIFDAQVQQKDQEQRRRAEETRSKILASHLRFKAPKEDSDPLNGCR